MTSIVNVPLPTKERNPRQKSIDVSDLFLTRFTPPWSRPASLPANVWRAWVLNQPVAIVCRETLIANLISLDWKITPVDSKYKEELEATIKYYTKLFKNGGDYLGLGLDFSGLIEWIVGDLLDTPFGGIAEIGRKGESAKGRVQWIRPLDAGTMFPLQNQDFPVVQYYPSYMNEVVTFRPWEVSRMFMSPHSFLLREGWGMAPPEKVYFALDLLNKGDKYYANLLLDIPTAGILDLGDMEKSSAEDWITAFKTFVNDNTTSFKIPVLYEHNNKVEFIPFGKVPNDIMFNQITSKYAALVAAAYGMSLSDIGLQTTTASGETLAGSIRQERRTRNTGFARIKTKTKSFFDHILPDAIEFNWIDYDDELNVAMGRARLASFTAFGMMQDKGVFSPQEIRSQIIQEGLVSISMPDEIPPDAKPLPPPTPFGGKPTNKNSGLMGGNPKAPSQGGEGEKTKPSVSKSMVSYKFDFKELSSVIAEMCVKLAPQMYEILSMAGDDTFEVTKSMIDADILGESNFGIGDTVSKFVSDNSFIKFRHPELDKRLNDIFGKSYTSTLKTRINSDVNLFMVRAIASHLNEEISALNDFGEEIDYTSLVMNVHENVFASLTDYLTAYINAELDATVKLLETQEVIEPNEDVLNKLSELSNELKQLSLTPKTPIQKFEPIINLPEISVYNNIPDRQRRDEEMKVIINNATPEQAQMMKSVTDKLEQLSGVVEKDRLPPTIQVNVPEQETPIIHVSSLVPTVTVNVPETPAPTVQVNVEPTPVNVKNTVNVPESKSKKKKITIRKDGNTWTGEES